MKPHGYGKPAVPGLSASRAVLIAGFLQSVSSHSSSSAARAIPSATAAVEGANSESTGTWYSGSGR